MICVNELIELKCTKRAILENLLILISPYAPHLAEELFAGTLPASGIDLFAVEGGTAGITYVFNTMRENRLLDFFTMQRLRRFARYWDLVSNSGVFRETAGLICAGSAIDEADSHASALPAKGV